MTNYVDSAEFVPTLGKRNIMLLDESDNLIGKHLRFQKCDPPCGVCMRIKHLTPGMQYEVVFSHIKGNWIRVYNDKNKNWSYSAKHFHKR